MGNLFNDSNNILKIFVVLAFSSSLVYLNSPVFEDQPGPDFSEFMSYLIYLEEDGSTMLYSDAEKNSITIASWALYRHQISAHTSFQGIVADENCPFFGITQKRIRDKQDIIEVLNNGESVLLSYSGCKTGIDNKTQNDFINFASKEGPREIAQYHQLDQEFSVFLITDGWWWASRFNREINSNITHGLLEKDPRNFCRVWTELLYVPIDSYYAWGPLRDFFSEGQEYCIPELEEAL